MPIFNKIGDGRVGWLCWFDVEWPIDISGLKSAGPRGRFPSLERPDLW